MPPYSRFSSFHSVGSRVLARPWDQAGRRRTGSVCSQKRRYIVEEFTLATMRNDWREQRTFSASIDRLPQCEGPRGNAHLSVWPLHSTPLLVSSPSPLLGCLRGRLFIYPSSCPDCLNLTAIGNHGVRKGRAWPDQKLCWSSPLPHYPQITGILRIKHFVASNCTTKRLPRPNHIGLSTRTNPSRPLPNLATHPPSVPD